MKIKSLISAISLAVTANVIASSNSATFTKLIKQVNVLPLNQKASPANLGQVISGKTAVQTGKASRAELTHPNKTITRLGQNTHFNFRNGSRDMELHQGAILLRVPKNSGGAVIRTATVTASISGTTLMMEYHKNNWVKYILLEGSAALTINNTGQTVNVPEGTMIIVKANGQILHKPVAIDMKSLVNTSVLLDKKQFSPLPNSTEERIKHTISVQQEKIDRGEYRRGTKNPKENGEKNAYKQRRVRPHINPCP